MCEVKLSHITFSYGSCTVLKNISLTVRKGSFMVVVGPNGAGKSTLLRMIAGLIVPADGRILIDGSGVAQARKRGLIGYVPQAYSRNAAEFPATVEEVVGLGLVTGCCGRQYGRSAARHIVSHMLQLVDVEDLRQRRIGSLSGGQQQRIMVARALAGNPALLLLDEPTSGIDYEASEKIYQLLGRLNQNLGITVIMVSHDLDKATQWATSVACINRGLCFFGSSEEFRANHLTAQHLLYYESGALNESCDPDSGPESADKMR